MSKTMFSSLLVGALGLILFIAVNIIINQGLGSARIDLTEDRLYSIADGTRTVLDDLDRPLNISFFFSQSVARDYPQIFSYGQRIRDLLREYVALSDGMLNLEIIEPEPFSEAEDRAVAAGLQGIPTASGEQIFMGLVARDLTDQSALIPYFSQDRADFLEYDLTRLIANIANPEKPKIG
ncbi:hypothetical protein JCM17846_14950 [Iodidimonas nitroreducens]|uniref:DUF7088 domain-containing protein n=1 Tax=Iodidimonas nitroreducens TaxID=1236968 RepID=A0A5A7N665_9PROT|nr:GldG family protein [Iodidimonas nitroreducens]GER03813.1 hypothetical protein JCM17846_14950 [Iodidimonas nitroreducens]